MTDFSFLASTRSWLRSRAGSPNRRLRLEFLEKRDLLAAQLTADIDAALGLTESDQTESVFWQDRDVEIRRGQWMVQYSQSSEPDTETDSGPIDADSANAHAWLQRRQPKQLITDDGAIERRLYEFEDVMVRSAMLYAFSKSPNVISVEPNYRLSIDAVPDDPSFGQLWGLDNANDADIDAPEAWDLTTGSSDMVVGVIDTGVDYNHEDLAQNIWVNPVECPAGRGTCIENGIDDDGNGYVDDFYGWDFYNNDNDPFDDNSHGTHVAGTIAAVGNNGKGVVGVNWNAKIMALKFLGGGGSGYLSDAVRAIDYATTMRRDHGINIRLTNNSWGGGGYSQTMFDSIAANRGAGMLFVAAAGNDSQNTDNLAAYPASYNLDNIISVAATTSTDGLSSFSNYGRTTVDVGAPGSSIYSTTPNNGYGTKSGTSMASPHVAGIAALAWGNNQGATYADVRQAIFGGVDPLPALSGKTVTGGRVNALTTLQRMGLFATVVSPLPNTILETAPTSFTVDFSAAINPSSLSASDLTVNSIAATGFSLIDANTVEFTYAVSPVTVEGIQTIRIAADNVTQLVGGDGNAELSVTFFYDPTPLQVSVVSPADGGILSLPDPSIRLDFSEQLSPGSIGIDDLVLSDGRVERVTVVDPDTVIYHLTGINNESILSVELVGGTIADTDGFPNKPFSASFSLDVTSLPYPEIWTAPAPLGSRIRHTTIDGLWHNGSDQDRYLLDLESGQTISLGLQSSAPDGGSAPSPRLSILDPDGNSVAEATAAAVDPIVINALTTPLAGRYTVVVGTAAGTGGSYELRMVLSALLESEPFSLQNNNTRESAQDLDAGWASLSGDVHQLGAVGSFATGSDTDWYALSLDAGVPTTLAVAATGFTQGESTPLSLLLYDASGAVIASGVTDGDLSRINDFATPASGVYFVSVSGGDVAYSLSATSGGTLDADRIDQDLNDSLAASQFLQLPPRVIGHLGGEFATGPGVDASPIKSSTIAIDASPEGDMIRDIVFTNDGTRYLIAHRDSENVLVYDSETGDLLAEIQVDGKPVDLEVTPNGTYALSANSNGDSVTVIDLATLSKVTDIPTSTPWPYRVHVTADSAQAVVATAGGDYLVISLSTLAQTHQFEASGLGALSQASSFGYAGRSIFNYTDFVLTPDATKLVGPGTNVSGTTVDIFNLTTGTLLASIPVPDESPEILMTADGNTVYAVSRRSVFESTISKIRLSDNSLLQEIKGPGLSSRHVLLSPSEQEVIGGRYGSLQFIDLATGTTQSVAAGDTTSFAISFDGNYLLARDLIDLSTKTRVKSLPFYSSMDFVSTSPTQLRGIQASRLSNDQYKWIDINGANASVLETRTGGSAIEGDTPIAMAVTVDGLTAVTANYGSNNLSVIDLLGKSVTRWIDVGFPVDSLAITPDGGYAIASSASIAQSVVLVDLASGTVDATLSGINYFPRDVAISDDGSQAYVVTTGLTDAPDSLYFIDVAGSSSSVARSIPIGDAFGGMYDFTRLQLSPDGSLLAIPVTGSGDLVLVDTATRSEIARIDTGQQHPTEVVFSPDGAQLFVRHQSESGIAAIRVDGANSSLQKVITGIPVPAAMTIDDAGEYLYVATSLYRRTNEVHVVDARSLDVIQTISLESDARPTRMHQDGNVIYLVASEEFTPRVFAAQARDTLMRIYAAGIDSEFVDAIPLSGRSRVVNSSQAIQSALVASQDQDLIEVIGFGETAFGDEDYYRFLPQVGDVITVDAMVPGSAVGLIDNELNFAFEVFNPQGHQIGISQGGRFQWTVDSIGAHAVRVFAQNFTHGEYLLSVSGASETPGPSILELTPPDGSQDVAPDATLSVIFDEAVSLGSGQIVIRRRSDDSIFTSINVTSAEVELNGPLVTVTPALPWELGTDYYVVVDSGTFVGSTGQGFSGISDLTLWEFSIGFGFDFGDAPAPYPVTQANAGARHSLYGPQLGSRRDSEADGTASAAADADDLTTVDDEDGVFFGSMQVGQIDAEMTINAVNVIGTAYVDAWIDFNADGHFGGKGERVAASVPVSEGSNSIRFDVPSWVASGDTFARVRLSTTGGLGITGNAPDGEVEDYRVTITPPNAASRNFYPIDNLSPKFSGGKSVVPVDLDGDGDMDLIHTDGSDNNVAWLENNGAGVFTEQLLYAQWNTKLVEASDFDRDGDIDVLYLLPNVDELGWFQNQGNESFTKVVIDNQLSTPQDFVVVDYDSDGDQDVLLIDNFDDVMVLYRNNGDQTFAKQTLASNVDASLMEVVDLDRDGDLDVVVNDDGLSWYEQTPTGLTQHAINTGIHYAVEIFDVDSDGVPDVVSADSFKVNWYKNNGLGSFTTRLMLNISSVRAVTLADLDGDGDMDAIAKATNGSTNLSWLENDGSENFQIRTLTEATNQPVALAAADLDGDSDLDVVLSTDFDGVAWIENTNGVELTVEALVPARGSAMIRPSQNLSIRFDQFIRIGSGAATLYSAIDESVVEIIDMSAANVTVDGDTLTIDPVADLQYNTAYYVRLNPGAVTNVPGDPFVGFETGQWTFQTVAIGIDYGDAPDASAGTAAGNYQTTMTDNGPTHLVSPDLYLGRIADADDGTRQNTWASADDAQSFPNDENSLLSPNHDLVLTVGARPSIAIVASNLTAADATLTGWIDYDRDGVFEASESAQLTVRPGQARQFVTLEFPPVPAGSAGKTFARLRLGSDTAATMPVGPSGIGEVEDYGITIRNPGLGSPESATELSDGIAGAPTLDAGDRFGASVAPIGDLDGDGVDDLAIAAPGDDDLMPDSGAVYIAMMNADGSIKSTQKIVPTGPGLPFDAGDQFGTAIASAGDLDLDGITDLYVMSRSTGNNAASISRVTLRADGSVKNHTYNLITFAGSQPQLNTFAAIGDLDGDGNPDFAFGENNARINNVFSGALHIMFTDDDGSPREFALIAGQIGGGPSLANFDYFGTSVSSLGDIDGDGVNDLAVGAYGDRSVSANSGAVYILRMNTDGTVKSSWKIDGKHANEPTLASLAQFGYSVSALGDLDANGVTELLVGADNMTVDSVSQAGQVFVLYLASDGSVLSHVALNGNSGGTSGVLIPPTAASFFGKSVAPAGDLNHDGHIDLVVGASPSDSVNRGMVRTILLDASPAPMITNLQINDGDIGRSQVTSLSVAFDSLVDHPALLDAFTLTHSESDTRVGQLSVTADDSTGKTIATIMFSGVSTVPRSGTGPRANSLADGNYQLVINANQIRSSTGTAMIGDYVWGQQAVDKLFRLFGDTDGDRDVDSQDYGQFGLSFLKPNTDPGYHAGLDFDGDGDVDGIDHARFKQNLFGHL